MKHLTAFIALVVVAELTAGCTQGERKISLRYKFEPGAMLTYDQVSKRSAKTFESDSLIKEGSMVFNMTVDQTVHRLLDDSTAEILETASWSYEKRNEQDTAIVDTIREKRELLLVVQINGKVRDVKSFTNESYTNIRYVRNYYEQGLPVFPWDQVTPGYSWTQTTKVVLPKEPMEASMTYKVASLVREAGYDCAVIDCNGTMIIPVEPDPRDSIQTNGLDRITLTGVLYFAYKEGMVVLQREQWQIDRDRKRTHNGVTKEYREEVALDIDFVLKSRSVVDSLAL